MQTFQFYEVGGCVRDSLLGLNSKDVDFSVVAAPGLFQTALEAFEALLVRLQGEGFKVFEAKPDFLTIRAQVAPGSPLRERTNVADFVLARRDGPYSDGRRPDWVKPGTLLDDLSRRDFSSGAIAKAIDGSLIDPFGGVSDVENKILRFVGNPEQRIREDGIRTLRGLRFQITKGLVPDPETYSALRSELAIEMLKCVSKERVREELNKMFTTSTIDTLRLLQTLPDNMVETLFSCGLRLDCTLRKG